MEHKEQANSKREPSGEQKEQCKRYVTKEALLGQVANNIVRSSPYIPEGLTEIMKAADAFIEAKADQAFKNVMKLDDMTMYGYDDEHAIHRLVDEMTHTVPEIRALNLSKQERDAGLTAADVDDESKRNSTFVFTSLYNSIKKDCDFVDLGALSRNISNEIKWEQQRNDAFDADFEKRHGKLNPDNL